MPACQCASPARWLADAVPVTFTFNLNTRARGRDYHNSDFLEISSMNLITSRYRSRTAAADR